MSCRSSFGAALLVGAAISTASGSDSPLMESTTPPEATPPGRGGGSDGGESKKKSGDAFEGFVEDFEQIDGLFTLYRDPETEEVYLSLRPEQLGTVYLAVLTREAGDGLFYDSGSSDESFPMIFERVGKKIRMRHVNVYVRAEDDSPAARAVARGVTSSLLASAELACDDAEDGRMLVEAAPFFVRDHDDAARRISRGDLLDVSFSEKESVVGEVKSFPRNTEIEVILEFAGKGRASTGAAIPDSRGIQHRWRYSLSALPDDGYTPRLADERIGHFVTMYQDYTDVEMDSPYRWYVNRWRLEKKDPSAELSEPVEPIVFWIENAVPERYRAAVREGTLLWNDAFERIGFENAIVVKQQPDDADWEPADVRYNVIRWMVMPGRAYAVGPSEANPFTGEIYAADVRLSADYVRAFFVGYEELASPLEVATDGETHHGYEEAQGGCDYAEGKAMEAAFGADLLAARTFVDPNSEAARQYVHDGLVDLVVHEVGHTLGLRHNFKASTIHSLDALHDRELTSEEGISGSVMDYNPVNIAPKGQPQGALWSTDLGIYDYLAIEYAYRPIDADTPEAELPILEEIASRTAEPKLAYGTDEDARGYGSLGVDPYATLYDLGADPVEYYRSRIALSQELISRTEATFAVDGARYSKMRRVFGRALRYYTRAATNVPRFVGGLEVRRDRVGDPGDRLPLQPVAIEKQRDALAFLDAHVFGEGAFDFERRLVTRMAPERRPDFFGTVGSVPRIDYPFHDVVLNIQRRALSRLLSPIRLNRLVDLSLYVDGGETMTIHELLSTLTGSIWREAAEGRASNSFRRNLQREYLGELLSLVVAPDDVAYYSATSGSRPAGTIEPPADARTLARAELVVLDGHLADALGASSLDPTSRAHYEESRARIQAAMDARVERDL